MKRRNIYWVLGLMAILAVGCKTETQKEEMSDAERLEVLDIKIDKNPKDASLLAERAEVLLKLGRTKEAQYDINRAVDLEPNKVEYRLTQADAYMATGLIESSYKSLTAAEAIEPDNMEVQLKLGEVAFYGHDYDRALACLSRVTEKEPDNRTALTMKGFIYKEKEDLPNAIGLLQKVCNLYPDYALAFEELGVIYEEQHDPLAVEYLTTAMRLEPTNTNAMYALAMYYQEAEEYAQAESLYRRMLDVNEHSSDAWNNLGYIELNVYHDYEKALEHFDKALESDAQNAMAYYNRGLAYEVKGERIKARADYESALAIDADFEPAKEGLKQIK